MRIFQAKRIFMNEADAGGGNGATPPPAAPAEPTAAPTAPVFDPDALVARLMGAFEEKLTAHQNATNAALRKAGVFKQDKPAEPTSSTAPQPATAAPQAAVGLSAADLDARFELERVIASREAKHGLTEAQAKRLRSALSGVPRDSLASEADSYLSDLGLVKAATPPPQPAPQSQPATPAPAKPNISDRGSAAPTDLRDFKGVLNSRPLEMTGHDVESLILAEGEQKGYAEFQAKVLNALSRVRIKPPRG
jgi:hypothetical protein